MRAARLDHGMTVLRGETVPLLFRRQGYVVVPGVLNDEQFPRGARRAPRWCRRSRSPAGRSDRTSSGWISTRRAILCPGSTLHADSRLPAAKCPVMHRNQGQPDNFSLVGFEHRVALLAQLLVGVVESDGATITITTCPFGSGPGSFSNSHRPSSEGTMRIRAHTRS